MNTLTPFQKLNAWTRVGIYLFLLALSLAAVTPLRADNPPTYLFQIASSAVPGGFEPTFVALDASNNVYVAEYDKNRIVKFTTLGTYLTQWGSSGSGNGQFELPQGVAIDGSDNVYVADQGNNRIEKFNSSGTYLTKWGSHGFGNSQFDYAEGVAVDGHNDIYVADNEFNDGRVEKFTSNGTYSTQWGSEGSDNGQFYDVSGIAVDSSNNVYVADPQNNRIEKFASDGTYLAQWGSTGSGNGQFEFPEGVAVDSSNNVYVADEGNERIEKFNSSGTYLTQWGSIGHGNGQFEAPEGVAVDSSGNFIYVVDSANNRVQVFANNTSMIQPLITAQPSNQSVPAGVNVTFAISATGAAPFAYQWSSNNVAVPGATNAGFTLTNVSLADSGSAYSVLVTNSYGAALSSNAVLTILPSAEFVAPTYLFQIDSNAVPGGFDAGFIGWMAVDASNNIYLTDDENSRVVKLAAGGTYLSQWGSYGSGDGQFSNPEGITLDSSNNVYVADDFNYRIEKFDNDGNYLTQWGNQGSGNGQFDSYEGEPNIGGIAVDNSNDVYVADEFHDRIQKFDSNGHYLTQWGSPGNGNGQFLFPDGVALDNSNDIYAVDADNSRVEKFDRNGNYLTQWGSTGSGNGQFLYPEGVALDISNNVYVADTYNHRVEKFDSNGSFLTQWGSLGGGKGQLNSPAGIAVDSSGNIIYVVDVGNARIQVFVNDSNIVPPIVTSQPVSQTVPGGINVAFAVGVVGTAPFIYQWNSNNVAVSGATNATFTLTNVSLSDSAAYSVLVANSYGSSLSSHAVLTVLPSIVLTQPASSITTNGAVLNGSVTVGSDETAAWFEWGTDTNYGNIADETIVPGNSHSNNISAALTLPGNVYHYRIDAANDFGIAYGNDEVFAIGLPPTATTLAAVNSANGSTLNASVNPNGLDTTVYFTLISPTTTNTAGMDIGTGVAPLNVSSFITGLAPASQYRYEVVASNYLGTVFGASVTFFSPPFVTVPSENWDSVASSADGRVLVAVANRNNGVQPFSNGGPIFISTNSGVTWVEATGAPTNGLWETVACSADGSKMIAAGGGGDSILGPIYTSTDMGMTWVSNNAPVINWQSVASSADGTRLVAAAELNQVIYTSTNSGVVWTQAINAPKVSWFSVALSADGTKLAAVAQLGSTNIYTSPDFGTTWITHNVSAGPPQFIQRNWSSIASSSDGSRLVAAGSNNGSPGFIFISTNSGAEWKLTATNFVSGLVAHSWICVASSTDGSKLAAVSDALGPLGLITSTNSGASWTTNAVPFLDWNAVALSADGAKLVATVGYPSIGPIYVLQTTPSPVLSLSAADNVLSWIIPSLDFTLQQSPDLQNWTDVTNPPMLNLTNLQNQVTLPAPDGNSFFRLMH
jgi:DNA-binding beta-propeller fold protein YncE